MAHARHDRARRRPRRLPNGDVPHPAGNVLGAIVVALVLGLLLNADSLHEKAHAQDDGWPRRLAVNVMGPVRTISRATLLDRPRVLFEETFRDKPGRRRKVTTAQANPVTATTIAPPVVRLRVPSAADPLRLWVGGDSMAQVFGQSVVAKAVERGDITATLDYRISTGLTRPDFFDWPGHIDETVLPSDPEVVVIMFGANDAQSMSLDGRTEQVRTPAWQAEYRQRVAATMDQLVADDRLVVWVGQPVMRDKGFSERETILDGIYRDEASRRPWIRFVDTRSIFSPDGRTYTAYLPGSQGTPVLMRKEDGIHLTRAGGDRLADAVLALVDAEISKAGPPGATPSPPGPAPTVATTPPPPPTTAPPSRDDSRDRSWFASVSAPNG